MPESLFYCLNFMQRCVLLLGLKSIKHFLSPLYNCSSCFSRLFLPLGGAVELFIVSGHRATYSRWNIWVCCRVKSAQTTGVGCLVRDDNYRNSKCWHCNYCQVDACYLMLAFYHFHSNFSSVLICCKCCKMQSFHQYSLTNLDFLSHIVFRVNTGSISPP